MYGDKYDITSMIGIKGRAGSGKTTVAKMLKVIIDYFYKTSKLANYDCYLEYKDSEPKDSPVKIYNFADALKEELAEKIGIPVSMLYDEEVKQDYVYSFTRRIVFNRKFGFDKLAQPSFVDLHDWLSIANCAGYPDHRFEYYIPIRLLMQQYGTEINRGIFGGNVWINKLDAKILKDDKISIIGDVRFINESDYIYKHNGKCILISKGTTDSGNLHASEVIMADVNDIVIRNNKTKKDLFNDVLSVFKNYFI